MALYLSRWNKIGDCLDFDVNTVSVMMMKEFTSTWCLTNGLCSVGENNLIFGLILS